jgi:tRNA pseudouridine38-40 synthase
MPRYFIEVAYKGTAYSGFQVQDNANSIQAEVEKAFSIFFKKNFEFTGSSRTDAGVHAKQNYFHVDVNEPFDTSKDFLYNLNALLPGDIVIKKVFGVKADAHCRFDAKSREYKYFIYREKDPFLSGRAFYYPYKIDIDKLNEAAKQLMRYEDFTSFSKTNTQVKNFICRIEKSEWYYHENMLVYDVVANRFLRGMVKALTGTMLRVGRGKISVDDFCKIIESRDPAAADFSPPSHGLFLIAVNFPGDISG